MRAIRNRRGWRQFSLRALLLLMLVTVVSAWWISTKSRHARAVDRLTEIGIAVSFDDGRDLAARAKKPLPQRTSVSSGMQRWLEKLLGENAFRTAVSLRGTKQIDADVLLLNIQYFKHLKTIYLNHTQADDVVLAAITRSPNLETLYLGASIVTDEGINKQLVKLPKLSKIVLWETNIGDDSAGTFAQLPDLSILYLSGTNFTDQGVALLPTSLTELALSRTKITSAAGASFAKMPHLQLLLLQDTAVSDAVIPSLSQLTSLRQLTLSRTQITEDGMQRLRIALPACNVHSLR